MFLQFIRHLPKGMVRAKVNYRTLQWPGTASTNNFGALTEGAKALARTLIDRLGYLDLAEGTVPVKFFLPLPVNAGPSSNGQRA